MALHTNQASPRKGNGGGKEPPAERLRLLARAAIVRANGDSEKAMLDLDGRIVAEDDAALERELTSAYRNTALRAVLATHFHELRAEGKVRQPGGDTRISTTDYSRTQAPAQWRPGQGRGYPTPNEILADAQRALQRRWLEEFKINGRPIGDATVNEADGWANRRERDTIFVRLLTAGLPGDAVIRDFRTNEDAETCWQNACQQQPNAGAEAA